MVKPVTAEEQEALFQAIIRGIPSVEDPAKLQEVATLALALMLRRPADRELKDELTRQVHDIIAAVKPGASAEATRNEMRFAARGCIKVLQAAKERRLPRRLQPGGETWARSAGGHPAKPAHHPPAAAAGWRLSKVGVAAIILLVVALIAGYSWWNASQIPEENASEIATFVRQVTDAAKGEAPPAHIFGGTLKTISLGGRPVVVAENIPPRACAASGWALVRGGILSINGVTPQRVSAGKITELCNSEDGNASIMWSPK